MNEEDVRTLERTAYPAIRRRIANFVSIEHDVKLEVVQIWLDLIFIAALSREEVKDMATRTAESVFRRIGAEVGLSDSKVERMMLELSRLYSSQLAEASAEIRALTERLARERNLDSR